MSGDLPRRHLLAVTNFLSFLDDYSRRCWLYTMKHKGEVLELFMEWKKNMEKTMGKKAKLLCSDNGGKYISDPFL